ncbi:MAG: hypothetical protein EZS28_046138, partial [Streblomastix strix]
MRSGLGTARDLMRRTMGLIVAFSATRMVELARITRNDITFRDEIMIIKTVVKKYKKPKLFEITFNKRQIPCCPVDAMKSWLSAEECTKKLDEGIWWDYERKKKLGGTGCCRELKLLLDEIGIDKEYAGSTVRHAMMTKLRDEGATQEEVNEATRHASGSNTCDMFYYKPIARDIGALILKDFEDYPNKRCYNKGSWFSSNPLVGTPQAQVPRLARLVAVRRDHLKRNNQKCAMKKKCRHEEQHFILSDLAHISLVSK